MELDLSNLYRFADIIRIYAAVELEGGQVRAILINTLSAFFVYSVELNQPINVFVCIHSHSVVHVCSYLNGW